MELSYPSNKYCLLKSFQHVWTAITWLENQWQKTSLGTIPNSSNSEQWMRFSWRSVIFRGCAKSRWVNFGSDVLLLSSSSLGVNVWQWLQTHCILKPPSGANLKLIIDFSRPHYSAYFTCLSGNPCLQAPLPIVAIKLSVFWRTWSAVIIPPTLLHADLTLAVHDFRLYNYRDSNATEHNKNRI